MTNPLSKEEELQNLRNAVVTRNAKISDVDERIVRQKDHISKTQKKKERFEGHRARWLRQNRRDIKRINELEKELGVERVDLRKVVLVPPLEPKKVVTVEVAESNGSVRQ